MEIDKRNFAFGKMNFILLAAGMVIVLIGFVLMSGSGSSEKAFNPQIFSAIHVKVAPAVCFIGFISIVFAILHKPKDTVEETKENTKEE